MEIDSYHQSIKILQIIKVVWFYFAKKKNYLDNVPNWYMKIERIAISERLS